MVTDTANPTPNSANENKLDTAMESAKSMLGTAQEKLTGALDATVGAAKENPAAAAAIAAGAVAAVGGVAYAASQLLGDKQPQKRTAKSPAKGTKKK